MDLFAAQTFGSGDLRGDDALGVTRSAAVDAVGIFGGCDEGRDRVHVRGECDGGLRMVRHRGVDVEAIAFHGHLLRLIAEAAKFSVEVVADGGFVAAD